MSPPTAVALPKIMAAFQSINPDMIKMVVEAKDKMPEIKFFMPFIK